jgi:hypothetical protein
VKFSRMSALVVGLGLNIAASVWAQPVVTIGVIDPATGEVVQQGTDILLTRQVGQLVPYQVVAQDVSECALWSWEFWIQRPNDPARVFQGYTPLGPGAVCEYGLVHAIILDTPGQYVLTHRFSTVRSTGGEPFLVTTEVNLRITAGLFENHPPVAVIAPIGPIHPGSPVVLDGTQSSDPDVAMGDAITAYEWLILRTSPPVEVVGRPSGALAPFVFPTQGTYEVTLVVRDSQGLASVATLQVSTFNTPPVADAGIDINLTAPTSVVLPCYTPPCDVPQGNQSFDPDGDSLTYRWVRVDPTTGVETVVSDQPIITPPVDASVNYRLEVTDTFGAMSSDVVTISMAEVNQPPVAAFSIEGPVREVGKYIDVDGSLSYDPDGDLLTFRWMLTSVPEGSTAAFEDPTAVYARFFADVAGTYVVKLIVNDGQVDGSLAMISIVAVVLQNEAVAGLQELSTFISGLSNSEFKKKDQREKFINLINSAILEVNSENYTNAIELMRAQLFIHVDGCRVDFSGVPDSTDWLVNCGTQRRALDMLWSAYDHVSFILDDGEAGILSPAFDVKPGTAGNPINPLRDVEIPLAVLSSDIFYAPLMWHPINPNYPYVFFGTRPEGPARGFDAKVKDVNGDGILDLLVKIKVAETGIVCGGPTEVFLYGATSMSLVRSTGTITLKGCP